MILLATEVFGLLYIQNAVMWETTTFRHLENTGNHVKKEPT